MVGFTEIERTIVDFYEANDVKVHEAGGEWFIDDDGQFSLTALAMAIIEKMSKAEGAVACQARDKSKSTWHNVPMYRFNANPGFEYRWLYASTSSVREALERAAQIADRSAKYISCVDDRAMLASRIGQIGSEIRALASGEKTDAA